MIDTQLYRIRIGRFYGSTRRMCVKSNRNINVTKSTNKNLMTLLVLLLCGVGMLFVGNLLFNTVAGWNENADILSGDGMKLRDGMKLKEWSECITTIMMIGMSVGEWMRMLIGNGKDFFMHWNGGSSFMENKIEEIQQILCEKNPCFLAISEANLRDSIDNSHFLIENYELLKTKSLENENMRYSRIVIFIRRDVSYKRRYDLENDVDSMIWIDILFKGGRKMTCGLIYREFKLFRQPGMETGAIEAQLDR